jgi:hypothetical protein
LLENEATTQKSAGFLVPQLSHTEIRIEAILALPQSVRDVEEQGNPVSQLALALNCRKSAALLLAVESRSFRKVAHGGWVLLDAVHQEEKLLEILDCGGLNMETGRVYFDGMKMRSQTGC